MVASAASALAISTSCWLATESAPTSASQSMLTFMTASTLRASSRMRAQSIWRPRFLGQPAQEHVLGDGEGGDQRELLEHGGDAGPPRGDGVGQHHRAAGPQDAAAVRLVGAAQRLDEGRFPAPVLAQEPVDLAAEQPERHAIVGDHLAEALGDGLQLP